MQPGPMGFRGRLPASAPHFVSGSQVGLGLRLTTTRQHKRPSPAWSEGTCSVHREQTHGESFRHKWLRCRNVGSLTFIVKDTRLLRTVVIFATSPLSPTARSSDC